MASRRNLTDLWDALQQDRSYRQYYEDNEREKVLQVLQTKLKEEGVLLRCPPNLSIYWTDPVFRLIFAWIALESPKTYSMGGTDPEYRPGLQTLENLSRKLNIEIELDEFKRFLSKLGFSIPRTLGPPPEPAQTSRETVVDGEAEELIDCARLVRQVTVTYYGARINCYGFAQINLDTSV